MNLAHHRIEWASSSLDSLWIQIQPTEVEIDCIAEPLLVAESARTLLDPLDPAVHPLGVAIALPQHDRIEDAPQVRLDL